MFPVQGTQGTQRLKEKTITGPFVETKFPEYTYLNPSGLIRSVRDIKFKLPNYCNSCRRYIKTLLRLFKCPHYGSLLQYPRF